MKKIILCGLFFAISFAGSLRAADSPALLTIAISNGICHAAFSPDNKMIVTASKDNTACIWDAETGQKLQTFKHDDWVRFSAFTTDGKKMITDGDERIVRIWDVESGKVLKKIEGRLYAFSPDRKKFAVAVKIANKDVTSNIFEMKDVAIYIWDADSVKELYMFDSLKDKTRMSVFSEDSKTMATISDQMTIRIWNVDSGKKLQEWNCGNAWYKITFSQDGTKLIAISEGVYARIWDVQSGRELQTLEGHEDLLHSVAFSPDGKTCATTSSDETARIWDVQSGNEILKLQSDLNDRVILPKDNRRMPFRKDGREGYAKIQFNDILFAPDGTKILTAGKMDIDHNVRVWDVQSGKELYTLPTGTDSLGIYAAFSPNGKKIVTFAGGLSIRVWDLERIQTQSDRQPVLDF